MNRRSNRSVCGTGSRSEHSSLVNDHQEASSDEVPVLSEGEAESGEFESKGGVFKQLRRKLSSFTGHFSKGTSLESTINLDPVEVRKNGIIIVQLQRKPFYRCVPLPPGYLPSEAMQIVENQNMASSAASPVTEYQIAQRSRIKKQESRTKNREKYRRETEVPSGASDCACKDESGQHDVLLDVLYNNWVYPEF